MPIITGLHHVTAFAKDPRANLAFYTTALGLRLVKRTVNFDDPFTYHLYYGDQFGSPGTLLTHFPQPTAARARHGGSEILETTLAVAAGSLDACKARLLAVGTAVTDEEDAGRRTLRFADPDGMLLAAIEDATATAPSAPAESADASLVGIERVTISVPDAKATIGFLEQTLGFATAAVRGPQHDLTLGAGGIGQRLTILDEPDRMRQPMGAGTVHHVAWRVPDEAAQRRIADELRRRGVAPTPVMDRQYFRSIYFRIPGGVLFEIATDGPGFDVDEPRESLGASLKLPPQHEPKRLILEQQLLPLQPR